MTEIRFYHLERQRVEQALPALISKALEKEHRIIIKAQDKERIKQLNDDLWSFDPSSFIPHGTAKEGYESDQPVFLTDKNDNPNKADVLILLDQAEEPEDMSAFTLCCNVFDGHNQEALTHARQFWKTLKEKEANINYWQQTDTGWEKKA